MPCQPCGVFASVELARHRLTRPCNVAQVVAEDKKRIALQVITDMIHQLSNHQINCADDEQVRLSSESEPVQTTSKYT